MKSLASRLGAMFAVHKGRQPDAMRKHRERAKLLAAELGCEIENLKGGGFNVWPPRSMDDATDPFGGDHYAGDWIDALAMLRTYEDQVSKADEKDSAVTHDDEAFAPVETQAEVDARNRAIANAIIHQLGGKEFMFMCRPRAEAIERGVTIGLEDAFARDGVNLIEIRLNGRDLYDLEFKRVQGDEKKTVEFIADVHVEDLSPCFRDVTGLATRIPRFRTARGPEAII